MDLSTLGLKTSIGDFSEGLSYASTSKRVINESYELSKSKLSRVNYQANESTYRFTNRYEDTLHVVFRVSNANQEQKDTKISPLRAKSAKND